MANQTSRRFCIIFLWWFTVTNDYIYAWTTEEFEMFDLVEEINRNFYELLEVPQNAPTADIKRAYRKVCVQFHPDKNKAEDAEIKFRQCAAVYEVLKDEERRKQYDDVLEHGLPSWRQPVYYYRRVRKMSLAELGLLLMAILTCGQYVVSWSVYWERRFTMTEILTSKKKREPKRRKQQQHQEAVDEILEAELSSIPRPHWSHLLPVILVTTTIHVCRSTPAYLRMLHSYATSPRDKQQEDAAHSDDMDNVSTDPIRKPSISRAAQNLPVEMVTDLAPVMSHSLEDSQAGSSSQQQLQSIKHSSQWSEHDLSTLTRLMSKYPGGLEDRWDKIAAAMNRDVNDVTKQAKYLKKRTFASPITSQGADECGVDGVSYSALKHLTVRRRGANVVSSSSDGIISSSDIVSSAPAAEDSMKSSTAPTCELQSVNATVYPDSIPSHGTSTSHSGDNTESAESDGTWSQVEQKLLERALKLYPRGSSNRWDCIADTVKTKSKEECMARFKEITELVKQRRMQQQPADGSS